MPFPDATDLYWVLYDTVLRPQALERKYDTGFYAHQQHPARDCVSDEISHA